MHAGHDDERHGGGHDDISRNAYMGLDKYQRGSQSSADKGAQRPKEKKGDGRGNQKDQHGLQEVLRKGGRDLLHQLLYIAHHPCRKDGGDDAGGIVEVRHRNPQEIDAALSARQSDEIGVDQDCHDGGDKERIAAELPTRGKSHQDRQEIERGVADDAQKLHGRILCWQEIPQDCWRSPFPAYPEEKLPPDAADIQKILFSEYRQSNKKTFLVRRYPLPTGKVMPPALRGYNPFSVLSSSLLHTRLTCRMRYSFSSSDSSNFQISL